MSLICLPIYGRQVIYFSRLREQSTKELIHSDDKRYLFENTNIFYINTLVK